MFIHICKNCKSVRVCWITSERALSESLRKKGYDAEYKYSIRGIFLQLRAGVAIFTHSVEYDFFAPLFASRVKRVLTWHGMPIKKIGYDNRRGTCSPRLVAKIITLLFPFRNDRVDLVMAGASADKMIYESAFNTKASSVVITGYPRNDIMARSTKGTISEDGLSRVIYMPTFRGAPGSDFLLFRESNFDFKEKDKLCHQLGIELWIKLHPVQRLAKEDNVAISQCTNIKYFAENTDIYESIDKFSILITDFSGIYFDYLITGRPIILAPLKMNDYIQNDRDLYYTYEELCPSAPCHNWDEVFNQIERYVRGGEIALNEDYMKLQKRFHEHLDDKSTQRAYNAIEKMLSDY